MTVVVDASVVIKWLLQDPGRGAGTEKATQLMESVTRGELTALQPAHWLAEVGAVLARESPGTAVDDVTLLNAFQLAVTDDPLVLRRGAELAIELKLGMACIAQGVKVLRVVPPECVVAPTSSPWKFSVEAATVPPLATV